ncbi:MAG: thiamine phosphate synthase [Spirochaetales bacterium]|nr:thiamine phosphate synthase [Spirochaetales bacterium]
MTLFRMADANFNRASEGIRVLEDYCRFQLEDSIKARELKFIRHKIREYSALWVSELIYHRSAQMDPGLEISQNWEADSYDDPRFFLQANFRRAQESLRVLSELMRLNQSVPAARELENLRFALYELEEQLIQTKARDVKYEWGLYGITAEKFSRGRSNLEVVKEMIHSGIKIIQYREKEKSFKEQLSESGELARLCREKNCIFLINDHVDLAMLVNAHGVHLGQDDMPVKEARKILGPDKIIGLSTHSPEQARAALSMDVDYIGVGPIYGTGLKEKGNQAVGLEYLEYVDRFIPISYVAIGGITEENISEIALRGAKNICLVRDIVGSPSISNKIMKLRAILSEKKLKKEMLL